MAPQAQGFPKGSERQIRESGGNRPLEGFSAADLDDVRLTTRAVDSFRFHHGGGIAEAEARLRAMLEDFVLKSMRARTDSGYLRLTRQGFSLLLSPDLDAVVEYKTGHRERTWEQVRARVPSRIRHKSQMGRWSDESTGPPELGPPIPLDQLAEVLDPERIYLTPRVRRLFVRNEGLVKNGRDERLDAAIRAEVRAFASGRLTLREDGVFEVTLNGRVWLISPDARTLIAVKRAPQDI